MANYPENISQQFGSNCTEEERRIVCEQFQQEVRDTLINGGLILIDLHFRPKTQASIAAKVARYKPEHRHLPLSDIYGIRPILKEEEIWVAAEILRSHFRPPERYPWGLPSVLDHTNPANQSRRSHPNYRAIHLYVQFCAQINSEKIDDLGEIQLMTWEWEEIAKMTRENFEAQKMIRFSE